MGFDVGLTAPGLAIVEANDTTFKPGRVVLTRCFIPEVSAKEKESMSVTQFDVARIEQIFEVACDLILQYRPEVIVVELPTGGAKSASAIKGMAISTCIAGCVKVVAKRMPAYKGEFVAITPLQNKKGSQGATKRKRCLIEYEQTKWNVLAAVNHIWPNVEWPKKKSRPKEMDDALCWAIADALSCCATYLRRKGGITANF